MPLPVGGKQCWPPKECGPINDKIMVWSAWYSGDPDQLSAVYGGTLNSAGAAQTFFGSESGTSVIGKAKQAIQRWFWGKRTTPTEQRTKLHIPAAGDIAAASADLLFSEPPKITSEDVATQARIEELVDDGMHATLLEGAELAAALSGVYLRVVWDKEVNPDGPWLSTVHPDAAVPEWRYGRLWAVTFWRCIAESGQTVVRHLERHEVANGVGKILHGVYEGTREELGQVVPLTQYPDTAGLAQAELVDGNTIITGATRLTAVYVPNIRPNRIWRQSPYAAPLGRSDFAGVEQLMDALDEVYSSLMRDVDQGKGRLIVPDVYLQSQGRGRGAIFDTDQSVFSGMQTLPSKEGLDIEKIQFDIRVEQHLNTAHDLFEQIVGRAGYSAQTFGLTGDVSATATEVTARERRSFMLRDRKIRYWRPGLGDILAALLEVDAAQFGTSVQADRPGIEFGDSVSADQEQTARTLQLLEQAGAISTRQKVITLHPDWDDPAIDEEVELIDGQPVEDPATFTGAPPPPGVPAGPEQQPAPPAPAAEGGEYGTGG